MRKDTRVNHSVCVPEHRAGEPRIEANIYQCASGGGRVNECGKGLVDNLTLVIRIYPGLGFHSYHRTDDGEKECCISHILTVY